MIQDHPPYHQSITSHHHRGGEAGGSLEMKSLRGCLGMGMFPMSRSMASRYKALLRTVLNGPCYVFICDGVR